MHAKNAACCRLLLSLTLFFALEIFHESNSFSKTQEIRFAGFLHVLKNTTPYLMEVFCYKDGKIQQCHCATADMETHPEEGSSDVEESMEKMRERLFTECELKKDLNFNVWAGDKKAGTFKITDFKIDESCSNDFLSAHGTAMLNGSGKKAAEDGEPELIAMNNAASLTGFYPTVSYKRAAKIKQKIKNAALTEYKKKLPQKLRAHAGTLAIEKLQIFDADKDGNLEASAAFLITDPLNRREGQENAPNQSKYFLFITVTFGKSGKILKTHILDYSDAEPDMAFYNAGQEFFIALSDIDADGKAEMITYLAGYDGGTYRLYVYDKKTKKYKELLLFGGFAC